MHRQKCEDWIILILAALFLLSPVQGETWKDLEKNLEGRELIMRPTIEGRRKLYINAEDTEAFVFHRGKRLFPLFRSEPVRIIDVDPEEHHIRLELQSSRLGKGRIEFHGPAQTAEDFERWLDEVFEVTTAEADFHRYIGNRVSQMLHLRGANHLPTLPDRTPFRKAEEALEVGYGRCGVCFVATPNVSGYETEKSLAMFGLQQVRATYYPFVNAEWQADLARIGAEVLARWPLPLKGYRYRFQVVDADDINAFAVPTGYIFITRGLLESLESEHELAAILAHEIAHVESRHTYRSWRNARNFSMVTGILGAIAGGTNNAVDDIVAAMSNFTAALFMAGHGRDREREADLFASYYLHDAEIGDYPLLSSFRKLKFARDAYDPLGQGGGLFASHPHIDERLEKANDTVTKSFPIEEVFHGLRKNGALVAVLRFNVQRLFLNELDVIATLSTTAELGGEDNVNTLTVRVAGQRIRLKERTAEKVFPNDEVSAVFGTDNAYGLIQAPIAEVDLKLKNVKRWERVNRVR